MPSRRHVLRDAFTFAESSICKRCGATLERSEGKPWILATAPQVRQLSGQSHLPPRLAANEERAPVNGRYATSEAREAYRRGARALYEGSLDKSTIARRQELAEWFIHLDEWTEGDPPPPPRALPAQNSAPQAAQASPTPIGQSTEFVFRVRLEVPVEGSKPSVTVEGQDSKSEAAEGNVVVPDRSRTAEILQRFRAAQQPESGF